MNSFWANVAILLAAFGMGNLAIAGFLSEWEWGIGFGDGNFLNLLIVAFGLSGKFLLIVLTVVCGYIVLSPPDAFKDDKSDK